MTHELTPDERDEALVLAVMANTGLSREDADALVANAGRASDRHFSLQVLWVDMLDDVTRAIVAGRAEPFGIFACAFWIRLFGAITELRDAFTKTAQITDELTARGDTVAPVLASEKRIHTACEALRDALTEQELMFVALARHTSAHVTQKGFAYGFVPASGKQRASVRTTTKIPIVGEGQRSVDDVMASCAELVAAHGGDEDALTRAIASKMAKPVAALAFAFRAHRIVIGAR
jgi:hypothetical protein